MMMVIIVIVIIIIIIINNIVTIVLFKPDTVVTLTFFRVTLKHGVPHWGTPLVYLLVYPYIVVFGQVKDFLSTYNISFINSGF